MKILLIILSQVYASSLPLSRFAEADRLYAQRANESLARKSLEMYRLFVQEKNTPQDAFQRLAMACQFVGMRYETDSKQKIALFLQGKEAGLRAIERDPNCGPCHFWTAINMALYAKEIGIFKTLFTLPEVQDHLKKAAELSPTYALGGAYRVLALIERNLPGILGGSDAKAVEYLERAIALSPKAALNYLVLARVWRDGYGDRPKALEIAQKGAVFIDTPQDPIEEQEAKQEIKSLVEELKLPPPRRPSRDVNR